MSDGGLDPDVFPVSRRIQAEQAHAVPSKAYSPRNPWDGSEFRGHTRVIYPDRNSEIELDEFGGWVPPGSTAQGGFQQVRWFRCSECEDVLRETHLESHVCGES